MKLAFSIKALLLAVLVLAIGLTAFVTPRIRRDRVVRRLEAEPLVWNLLDLGITEEPTEIDKLLGLRGRVDYLHFRSPSDERETLVKNSFENARQISPLRELEVESLNVEPCNAYPLTEKLVIRNLGGEQAGEWIRGLLDAQTQLKTIEVEWVPAFTDKHLEILRSVRGLEAIVLRGTTATGVGFSRCANGNHLVELDISDCPISDEGMRAIADLEELESLFLDFSSLSEVPNLRPLLSAPQSLDVLVRLGNRSETPELVKISKELQDHFGFHAVYYEDLSKPSERISR